MKFDSEDELLKYTSKIIGKTFKDIDSKNLLEKSKLKRNKGILGQVVETGFYKYPLNSDSQADFEELGIELKVSGYVKNKNGTLRAKERLVLSKIDFNKIVNETYETSHVLGKCKKMLIIWYEFDSKKSAKDFTITHYQLYNMENDEKIFKNDFKIIQTKVKDGKAHELSEGDTSYLGACTKAQTSNDRTTQPFSDIQAKPRAYSLKNAYMTGILRDLINNEKIFKNDFEIIKTKDKINTTQSVLDTPTNSELHSRENKKMTEIDLTDYPQDRIISVEEYVKDKLNPYIGKTQLEIIKEISDKEYKEKIPKQLNKLISDKIIGKDEELEQLDEIFRKTNYIIKNIPVNENKALERMSFKTLQISDFEEEWDNSYWKTYFEETTLIVICYEGKRGSKNGERVLNDVKKITFDDDDLDSFKQTYDMLKLAIEKKDISLLPTPNSFDNQMLEIAPKGKKGDNAYKNFFKNNKTKVAFMISKKLLNKKLKID